MLRVLAFNHFTLTSKVVGLNPDLLKKWDSLNSLKPSTQVHWLPVPKTGGQNIQPQANKLNKQCNPWKETDCLVLVRKLSKLGMMYQ